MKPILLGLALLLGLWAAPSGHAAVISGSGGSGGGSLASVTEFPPSPSVGQIVVVTDDSAVGECDSDAGSAVTLCRWDGISWLKLGDGTGVGGSLTSGDIDTCAELAAIIAGETGTCGSLVLSQAPTIVSAVLTTPTINSATMTTPILGTPISGTLTNTTGFPWANLAGAGTGVLTFGATPTSANFFAALTNETGSGLVMGNDSPSITTPTISAPIITGAITLPDGVRQVFNPSTTTAGFNVGVTTTDPSSPSVGDIYYDSGTSKFRCYEAGAWVNCIGATGGTSAFEDLISGTNTTATMLVGTGASLAASGSGTITATAVVPNAVALTTGTTGNYVASATADGGLTLTGTEGASLGMTPCSEGEIYKFTSSVWTCSADSTGGTPSFDTVATGSNTTATMTCGAGCAVVPTSTGVIAATAIRQTVVTVNAGNSPYTGLATDFLFLCDTSAAGRTITLPAATTKNVFHVKNLGANSCTINRAGSDTIDGGTSAVLTIADESISLESDGSAEWQIF